MYFKLIRNGNARLKMRLEKIKCLRSDNGGEYCSHEFEDYCSTNDIHRQKIVPRTPQENGVAERMNRTIMEHEVTCWVALTHVDGGYQYCYIFY